MSKYLSLQVAADFCVQRDVFIPLKKGFGISEVGMKKHVKKMKNYFGQRLMMNTSPTFSLYVYLLDHFFFL